jgi:hypothetical protein
MRQILERYSFVIANKNFFVVEFVFPLVVFFDLKNCTYDIAAISSLDSRILKLPTIS